MRPDLCWMYVSILSVLVLRLNAEGEDSECTPEIKVKRHTVYKAYQGDELKICCPFSLCKGKQLEASWHKYEGHFIHIDTSRQSHIKTELKLLNETEGISYLIFKNILRNDSGEIRCQVGITWSHTINISVFDSDKFRTNSTDVSTDAEPIEWLYVYSAAGIITLVVIVIIVSVVAMRGCKGKSKKEEQSESQYMAVPMVDQHRPQPRAGGSPSIPPCRRSTQKKTQPRQSYNQETEGRGRGRGAAKEEPGAGPSIIYAALNHQQPQGGGARPRRPTETQSEYAAIRVA